MDLTVLVAYTPFILVLGGILVVSWLLEILVKPVPVVGDPASWLIRTMSLFGFLVGFLLIVTAGVAWSTEAARVDTGTQYLLIVAGLALVLRPMKDFPWAALLSLAAGGLCAGFVFFFYPLPETVNGVSATWIYLLIFIFPAVIVYWILKFIEDVFRLIRKVLTFKPVTVVLGGVCIAQGILMLFDISLFTVL